jgi:hypothetical protein
VMGWSLVCSSRPCPVVASSTKPSTTAARQHRRQKVMQHHFELVAVIGNDCC